MDEFLEFPELTDDELEQVMTEFFEWDRLQDYDFVNEFDDFIYVSFDEVLNNPNDAEPGVVRLDESGGESNGDQNQREPQGRPLDHSHSRRVVIRGLEPAKMEIARVTRCQRVHRCAEGAHGGRQHSRDHQTPQAAGHHIDHKIRKHSRAVGFPPCHRQICVAHDMTVVNREQNPDGQYGIGHRNVRDP